MDPDPAAAPGQKRVVVLREGPPRRRGRFLDGALGVLGAVLLLVSVLLVNVLAETEEPDPQFRVAYGPVPVELPISRFSVDLHPENDGIVALGGGNALDFLYDLEDNNIYEVIVFVTVEDDFPESLPDTILVELLDPSGASVAVSSPQPTLPTEELPDEQKAVGTYYATVDPHEYRVAFNLGGKPEDQFVTFKDGRNGTLEEATTAVLQRDTRPTQGTWTVRIWVDTVGQCPTTAPGAGIPSQSQVRHEQLCALANQQNHGGQGDTGNAFTLNRLEYTYYDIAVSEA